MVQDFFHQPYPNQLTSRLPPLNDFFPPQSRAVEEKSCSLEPKHEAPWKSWLVKVPESLCSWLISINISLWSCQNSVLTRNISSYPKPMSTLAFQGVWLRNQTLHVSPIIYLSTMAPHIFDSCSDCSATLPNIPPKNKTSNKAILSLQPGFSTPNVFFIFFFRFHFPGRDMLLLHCFIHLDLLV